MRISIIGHTSTGKSTLAKRLSKDLGVPHLHLDRFWFEAGGNKLPPGDSEEKNRVRDYIERKVLDFLAGEESWISDGFYPRAQGAIADKADIIIFLDIPLWKRLLNHLERITPRRERHPELSLLDEWTYFPDIIRRHFRTGPKIKAFIAEHEKKVRRIRSRKEANEFAEEVIHKGLVL